MFISRDEINTRYGKEVSQSDLALANAMIEAYIGRNESDIEDASDLEQLGKATMFQVLYVADNDEVIEQAGIKSIASSGSTISFDTDAMAPHMSPWAVRICRNLSWTKPRSVKIGPIIERKRSKWGWLYE